MTDNARGAVRSSARLSTGGGSGAAAAAAASAARLAARSAEAAAAAARRRARAQERAREVEDSPSELREKCKRLAKALRNAKHLVVYTGAGISTAADIPDYRGPRGVWTRLRRGEAVGRVEVSRAQPTLTHMALRALWARGTLKFVVSQNCDGLHLRSGLPRRALAELHGDMFAERCARCRRVYLRAFDTTERTARHAHATRRLCRHCGAELADTIVHFGERGSAAWPLNWAGALRHAAAADVVLCLGSSLKVLRRYPRLWRMQSAPHARPALYIVNLQWTPKDAAAALKINARCDAVMAQVARRLRLRVPRYRPARDPLLAHAVPLAPQEQHTTSRPLLSPPPSSSEPSSCSDLSDWSSLSPSDSDDELPLRHIAERMRAPVSRPPSRSPSRSPSPREPTTPPPMIDRNGPIQSPPSMIDGNGPVKQSPSMINRNGPIQQPPPMTNRNHSLMRSLLLVPRSLSPPLSKRPIPPESRQSPPPAILIQSPSHIISTQSPPPKLKWTPSLTLRQSPPTTSRQPSPVPLSRESLPPQRQSPPLPMRQSSPPPKRESPPPPTRESSLPTIPRQLSFPPTKSSPQLLMRQSSPPQTRPFPSSPTRQSSSPITRESPLQPTLRQISPPTRQSPTPSVKQSPPPLTRQSPPLLMRQSPPPPLRQSPLTRQFSPPLTRSSPPLPVRQSTPPPTGQLSTMRQSPPPPVPRQLPPPPPRLPPPPDLLHAFQVNMHSGDAMILLRAHHAPSVRAPSPCPCPCPAPGPGPARRPISDLRMFRMARRPPPPPPAPPPAHCNGVQLSTRLRLLLQPSLPISSPPLSIPHANGHIKTEPEIKRECEFKFGLDSMPNKRECEAKFGPVTNDSTPIDRATADFRDAESKMEIDCKPKREFDDAKPRILTALKCEMKVENGLNSDESSEESGGGGEASALAAAIIARAVLLCRGSHYPGLHTILSAPPVVAAPSPPPPAPASPRVTRSRAVECAWCLRRYSTRRCQWYGPPPADPAAGRVWRRVRGRRYLCACCPAAGGGGGQGEGGVDRDRDGGGWYGKGYRKGRRRRR